MTKDPAFPGPGPSVFTPRASGVQAFSSDCATVAQQKGRGPDPTWAPPIPFRSCPSSLQQGDCTGVRARPLLLGKEQAANAHKIGKVVWC